MTCSGCGHENATGMKFCGECDVPLRVRCTSCGFENAPGIKFCGGCGQRLGESPKPSVAPDQRNHSILLELNLVLPPTTETPRVRVPV